MFDRHSTAGDVLGGHDLSGTHAVVTGGTAGIGAETARALAAAGARVVVTGRDPVKGRAAAAGIGAVYAPLDLADRASITAFVRSVRTPVTLLVLNAGVLTDRLTRTADGFETHFGVNHLGHFAVATAIPLEDARVVVLSSRAHRRADVDPVDPNWRTRPYDHWAAYGQSKTANALFALEFHRRAHPAAAVMPGLVFTDIIRDLPPAQLRAQGWTDDRGAPSPAAGWKSVQQAAASVVWAATAADAPGHIVENCAVTRPWEAADLPEGHHMAYASDPANAARLWELSERLLKD
ncbi:SDR family NAD(P)-dependent oxidoreductase [Actinokineospora sp. 24-640]